MSPSGLTVYVTMYLKFDSETEYAIKGRDNETVTPTCEKKKKRAIVLPPRIKKGGLIPICTHRCSKYCLLGNKSTATTEGAEYY